MAYIFTYNGIVQELQEYAQRTDTAYVNRIPVFMTLALTRISKDLKILGAVKYVNGTMIPNVPVMQKPSLWINNVEFQIGTGSTFETRKFLKPRVYESAVLYEEDRTVVGEPIYYSDYDSYHWLISPTPDQAYPFEVGYFQRFDPLDEANQTNWLTDNDPETLFLQCQLQSCIFTKNWSDYKSLQPIYVEAISSLIARDKDRRTDRYTDSDKD